MSISSLPPLGAREHAAGIGPRHQARQMQHQRINDWVHELWVHERLGAPACVHAHVRMCTLPMRPCPHAYMRTCACGHYPCAHARVRTCARARVRNAHALTPA
eukprot:365836-Chlamydomonas_euryale.AAC.9